jgi:hypothetical protein
MAKEDAKAAADLAEVIDEALAEVVETRGGVDEVDVVAMFSRSEPTQPRTMKARLAAVTSPYRKREK